MTNAEISIDLRGKVSPIKSKHGKFEFLEAVSWREGSQCVLIRYARDGIQQEGGVRMDIGKRAILDDFSAAKNMAWANASLRQRRAPQLWNIILEGLETKKREASTAHMKSQGIAPPQAG